MFWSIVIGSLLSGDPKVHPCCISHTWKGFCQIWCFRFSTICPLNNHRNPEADSWINPIPGNEFEILLYLELTKVSLLSTFNTFNGSNIWFVSFPKCVPEMLSIWRLLNGTKIPKGILVISAIESERSSVRFSNTGEISNKFIWIFPLMLRIWSFGKWHM